MTEDQGYGFTTEQIVQFKETFDMFDRDRNGRITLEELEYALRSVGQNPPLAELEDMLRNVDTDDFKQAFKMFDRDGDGVITVSEIGTVLRSLGQDPSKEQLKEMVEAVDEDGSGTIEFSEFLYLMSKLLSDIDTEEDLVEVFRVLDQLYAFQGRQSIVLSRDGDGSISKSDLRDVVKRLNFDLNDKDMEEMMTEADKDGNGEIDFEEFIKIVSSRS